MLNVIKPGFLGALLGFSLGVGAALAAVDIEIVENEDAAVSHTDVLKEFKKRRDARAEKLAQKGADMVDRRSGKPNLDRSDEYFTPVRTGYCECSCNAKASDPLQKEMNDVLESGTSNDTSDRANTNEDNAANDEAVESPEQQDTAQSAQDNTEKEADKQSDESSTEANSQVNDQADDQIENDSSNKDAEEASTTEKNNLDNEGDNTSTTESNRLNNQNGNDAELENKPADDGSTEVYDSSLERVSNEQDQNLAATERVNDSTISNLQGNNQVDKDKLQKTSDSINNTSEAAAWPLNRIKLN